MVGETGKPRSFLFVLFQGRRDESIKILRLAWKAIIFFSQLVFSLLAFEFHEVLALALLIGKTTVSIAHHGIPSEMAAHMIEMCLLKILLPFVWGVIFFSGI